MKLGLVLIDIQKDYFKGGKNELYHPEEAAKHAKLVLSFFRENNLPVFHVQHISTSKEAGFFIPQTDGVDIYKDVYPTRQEFVITKHTPDSFFQTKLNDALENQNVKHLVICGMMTHMCIDTTVRAARNFGYNITLIEDACATKDLCWGKSTIPALLVQKAFLSALSGSFAEIKTAKQWIDIYMKEDV